MKAVILAVEDGMWMGEMMCSRPKSMLPLFGRPVIEHLLTQLRKNGIAEACVVLGDEAEVIREYFGTGCQWGVELTYVLAGKRGAAVRGLKDYMPDLEEETFLVVPGNTLCDFDLRSAIEFHREKQAQLTLLLAKQTTHTDAELVRIDQEGRICGFAEPSLWRQDEESWFATGMLLINSSVLGELQGGEGAGMWADALLGLAEKGRRIYGCPGRGYWNRAEDWERYEACVADVFRGKIQLEMGLPQRAPGIWSAGPLPEGVSLNSPCWIGENVHLGEECRIGPFAVLEQDVQIGAGSMVQRSVLMKGAEAAERVTLYGAVLCERAEVRREVVLNAGVVLGEGAVAEECVVLMEGVRICREGRVPCGSRLTRAAAPGVYSGPIRFSEGGVISGVLGQSIDPEVLMIIGGHLGKEGKVALGHGGGVGARMLAQAAAGGITASGAVVLHHSLETPAQGAWLAQHYQIPMSLFIEQQGERVFLHFFGRDGLALGRGRERRLEYALHQSGQLPVRAGGVGETEQAQVGMGDYCTDAVRRARLSRRGLRTVTVAVSGDQPEERALKQCLSLLGCRVVGEWRKGIPEFGASRGGFRLMARDERGSILEPEQLLPLLCLLEMEHGGGKVAVPDGASAAVDLVAAGFGGACLRLGRDGRKAKSLYAALPWLWDAAFAAVRILSRMSATGESLEGLMAKTPRFSVRKREIPLTHDRARVMQELEKEQRRELVGDGVRIRAVNGWVYMAPLARRQALRVVAESQDMELAAELCDFYAGRVQLADRRVRESGEK